MQLFVVSRSRHERSNTLESLLEYSKRVVLVVPDKQVADYKELATQYKCRLLGCPHSGISLTRQFCGKVSKYEKFLMLDDDLKFFERSSETDYRLKACDSNSVGNMLSYVAGKLDEFAHVAISAREGNNRLAYEGAICSRPLRALAYRKTHFLRVEHGRVQIMEDFDVTLQLIRAGMPNLVVARWAQDQIQTQMKGGCSDYRTLELHEANVKKFYDLHKPFVKLRQKVNKTGGEFGTRLEATIYWQKAHESSMENSNG